MLDLGSTLTIASPGALTAAGFARSDARIKLTDTVIGGATGEPLRVREARCSVRLGGPSAAVQPLEVAVAELKVTFPRKCHSPKKKPRHISPNSLKNTTDLTDIKTF